jgi:hypothetical protein
MDTPIFIGGLMKSGTSLLRVLLGQHARLLGGFETHWFDPDVRERWEDASSSRMSMLLSFYDIDVEAYRTLCEVKRREPAREFIDVLMDHCAARAGKPRWVEKTPDNIRHWDLIRRGWPAPVLLHVTREYKDVYASWKARKGRSLGEFIDSVQGAYGALRELLGKTTSAYREIDYLDLVLDSELTMRRVLEHLGEPWDPACAVIDTEETTSARSRLAQIAGKDSATFASLSEPIFTRSIGQWREILTSEEARTIERELADWYDIFGSRWSRDHEHR